MLRKIFLRRARAPVTLFLVAFLAGCAGAPQVFAPDSADGGRYQPLTTPIIVLGDTQEHLSTGFPLHDNDSAIDAYVEVAQRPPEQALFGRRLMEFALHNLPEEPFLHLGDVMDLSCRVEAERMAKIFRETPQAGAILPGNHDGLMFGIYAYGTLGANPGEPAMPREHRWNRACRRGANTAEGSQPSDSEALTKRDFIALYIAEHTQRQPSKPGLQPPPKTGKHAVSWRSTNPDDFLSGVEARLIDGNAYADSFIAQRLQLPRAPGARHDTIIIGFDTNQAGFLVDTWDTLMGRSPGDLGHIHQDQIDAVKKWADEAIARGDIVVFAGHHNWRSLDLGSRARVRTLMATLGQPLVYLSAHTHTGFWTVHRALSTQPVLELNVSSLSDWPLAYRRISFAYDAAAKRIRVRGELMPKGVTPTLNDTDLLNAWNVQTCERSGVPPSRIGAEDLALVKLQRDSRGSLLEWLVSALQPICESCEAPLYKHGLSYLDEMLQVLLQVDEDLGRFASKMHAVKLPIWCDGQDFTVCARKLMAESAADFKSSTQLFRRKATLVALLNDHLDDLTAPEAKAYMTCRAVRAAKIDYDLIDDEKKQRRHETQRREEHFFMIEASVGMQ